jgi:hypothetical protein
MQERERRRGDIPGPEHGDFTDWDNPEDEEFDDDTPEGYYDEAVDDDSYIPGPEDPDYDLSEAAGYAGWEEPRRQGPLPQWVIVVVSLLLILVIVTPAILLID